MAEALSEAARLGRAAAGLGTRGAASAGPTGLGPYGELRALRRRWSGTRLADRYQIETLDTGCGRLRRIVQLSAVPAPVLPPPAAARAAALARLDLVFGIGPVTARRLAEAGHSSVEHLVAVDRYREPAAEVVAEWDAGDLVSICGRLTRRLGGHGHLLSALACGLVDPGDIVLLDLETLGLWNNAVFLGGVGRFADGGFTVTQYLAVGYEDEPALVEALRAELAAAKVLVTFNGRTADLPWLAERAFFHGLAPLPEPAHVDLVYGVRRRVGPPDGLPDARLATVCRHLLGLERPDDVPGWLVPSLYQCYAADPDRLEGVLVPVVDHNRADLEAVAVLLGVLCRDGGGW